LKNFAPNKRKKIHRIANVGEVSS